MIHLLRHGDLLIHVELIVEVNSLTHVNLLIHDILTYPCGTYLSILNLLNHVEPYLSMTNLFSKMHTENR